MEVAAIIAKLATYTHSQNMLLCTLFLILASLAEVEPSWLFKNKNLLLI